MEDNRLKRYTIEVRPLIVQDIYARSEEEAFARLQRIFERTPIEIRKVQTREMKVRRI